MDLQLIDKDLCESMLYRRSRKFGTLTGRDVADLLFLNTLMLYILSIEKPDDATDYAKKTAQYGPYTLFRTNATDLYVLGYVVHHPDNDHVNLLQPIESKRFLNGLLFSSQAHHRFIRRLSTQDVTHADASSYLYRLETQLKISNPLFKSWRRIAINWGNTDTSSRHQVTARMAIELKRIGQGSGIASELLPLIKRVPVINPDQQRNERPATDVPATVTSIKDIAGYWSRNRA